MTRTRVADWVRGVANNMLDNSTRRAVLDILAVVLLLSAGRSMGIGSWWGLLLGPLGGMLAGMLAGHREKMIRRCCGEVQDGEKDG